MKKIIIALLTLVPALAIAAGSSIPLDAANNDLTDKESLRKGLKTYVDYCLGCHQLQYQRWGRTFEDLDIPKEEGIANYMYTGEKVGDHIKNAMPETAAAEWFGTAPPDLTLVTRYRSSDWLYTYLRSFVKDESRPFGVNNTVFKDVGMPHVLQGLQDQQSAEEYDATVRDLVNFLEYTGEPIKLERQRLGKWVIGFLVIFFVLSWLLKKEYWKDVH
jgi:ubiquinol-cytochrome c reductase cytochrome c1 subunit